MDDDAFRHYQNAAEYEAPRSSFVSVAAVDLLSLIAAADRERVLVEALRPFAEAGADCYDDSIHESWSAWESAESNHVTIGHFRAASRALGGGE